MEYSVLMSVYAKEEPVYLDTAIQSMLDQTVRRERLRKEVLSLGFCNRPE